MTLSTHFNQNASKPKALTVYQIMFAAQLDPQLDRLQSELKEIC